MANDGLICWSCGRPTGITGAVHRNDECDSCMVSLRTCRGCRHFDPNRRYQCRETIDHLVKDKEKANFCDMFQMRNVIKGPGGISTQTDSKDSRQDRFDDLFND